MEGRWKFDECYSRLVSWAFVVDLSGDDWHRRCNKGHLKVTWKENADRWDPFFFPYNDFSRPFFPIRPIGSPRSNNSESTTIS